VLTLLKSARGHAVSEARIRVCQWPVPWMPVSVELSIGRVGLSGRLQWASVTKSCHYAPVCFIPVCLMSVRPHKLLLIEDFVVWTLNVIAFV
jgi:hypothetical protein